MDVESILQGSWEFRVEHKDIRIYSSKVSGSEVLGFKGEFELQVSLKKLIGLFHDMENYHRWVHHLVEMDVLERKDITECLVRQVINTPWPLQNREMIMRTGLKSGGENAIAVTMTAEPDHLPLNPNYHRVRESSGLWVFTPTGHGSVHVTFVMHIDPGSDVPSSVSNAGMFEVPFYSLNKLRQLAMDRSYNPPYPAEIEEHISIIEDIPDTL